MLRVIITLLLAAAAFGQWPTSPDTNLVICDRTGEQTLPKVRTTPDGGCYISWYDNSSGNYDMYLQRLDMNGVPQWPANGLLISNHPQETWITDYDMTVDSEGTAVLAFNDIRDGGDWDIYVYLIGPNGTFYWGQNGVAVSNNNGFEPSPHVRVTSGGNYAFAWQEETDSGNVVHVRKLSWLNGLDVFPPIILTAPYGCTNPRIVAADSDAIIVQYLKPQGTVGVPPQHIYAQKFDVGGTAVWAAGGVPIMTTNGIAPWMLQEELVSDGAGGAISYWYDTRDNNRHHVWLQRVLSNGTTAWTTNGVQTSLAADELEMSSSQAVTNGDQVMIFYMTADLNQNNWGIGGQALLLSNGERLWGNNGISFAALDARQRFLLQAFPENFGATVVYLENVTSGSMQDYVEGFGVSADGVMEWDNSPRMLCTVNSSKLHLDACRNRFGQVIAAWGDGRATGDDIYVQNINPNGTLGPLQTPPPAITITYPLDSMTLVPPPGIVFTVENFVVAESGGDGVIEVRLNGVVDSYHTSTAAVYPHYTVYSWYTIELELVHYDHTPLSPRVMDSVHVRIIEGAADLHTLSAPHEFNLLPAYPNPFNPRTMLRFGLEHDGNATLVVYDMLGCEAARPFSGFMTAGLHEIPFAATGLPGGIYFCRLQANGKTAVQKIVLLK
jgi:hypothetical protein